VFIEYNYFRQYNGEREISDFKEFYRNFMDDVGWGGGFGHLDYLVKYRFLDIFGHMFNILLRKRPATILDIGCGNGMNLPLANVLHTIQYHGLDYSQKAIEEASKIYPNIHFHEGDAFHMPFPDESFDMAISSAVLILYENEIERVALLREAQRILNENGLLVLIVWNEAWLLKNCIRLGRIIGRIRRQNLPKDFAGVYFSSSDVKHMVKKADLCIEECINTSSLYGVLECVRYLNMSKFNRKFGKAESEAVTENPQNIFFDLQKQAGRGKYITKLFYLIRSFAPELFCINSIYICRKIRKGGSRHNSEN
jgi:SAM-dependent methyltransferase